MLRRVIFDVAVSFYARKLHFNNANCKNPSVKKMYLFFYYFLLLIGRVQKTFRKIKQVIIITSGWGGGNGYGYLQDTGLASSNLSHAHTQN